MDHHVKEFIETNINEIEQGNWEILLSSYAEGVGAALYDAGIYDCTDAPVLCGGCFKDCQTLQHLTLSETVSIGTGVFRNCLSLETVTITSTFLTKISQEAFRGCSNLKHVTIPHSIVAVGLYCFAECGDDVVIHYDGTKEEWKHLFDIPEYFKNTYYKVECLDGPIVKKKRK